MHNRWTADQAYEWYSTLPWLVGCNFIPSTAVNQLEMWQEETFDLSTIDRELSWAANLGMNTIRVFLHDLLWEQDAQGFKARIRQFLDVCERKDIRVMFVLFDDCWFPDARLGPQAEPVPGIHNSRWLQSPGHAAAVNPNEWPRLKRYVQGVVDAFAHDRRVLIWDVYNEMGNLFLPALISPWYRKYPKLAMVAMTNLLAYPPMSSLLKESVGWIREVGPSQPLTVGIWFKWWRLNSLLAGLSDVISFHHYGPAAQLEKEIVHLMAQGRPVLCTEYMARTLDSRFERHLPVFKKHRVGCWNWGLVSGKTQTIHAWEGKVGDPEPEVWFHDIFRKDGKPYSMEEFETFKRLVKEGRG